MATPYPTLPIEFPFTEGAKRFVTVRSSFEDEGVEQTRAKVTTGPRQYEFTHRSLTASEVTTWQAFWDSMKGGAGEFDFTDPRTAATVTCRFRDDVMRPDGIVKRTGPQTYDIGPIVIREKL